MNTDTTAIDQLKYVRNFHNGKAEMFIHTHIGFDATLGQGITSQEFVNELSVLINDLHVQHIDVHINSVGGSVIEGMGIFTALMNAKALIHTHADGVAASISGIIFQAGKKRFMNDFARVMIHDVAAPVGTDSAAVDNFREMIIKVLLNNTGKSREEVLQYMTNETWFTAPEAISAGLADQVINTNRLLTLAQNKETDLMAVYNAAKEILNDGETPNNNQNQLKMLKITNALDLQEGANEETVLNAVKEIQNQVKTEVEAKDAATEEVTGLKTENEALKSEIEALKTAATEANDAAAITFVENAIKDGKIEESKREAIITMAKNDLDSVKNLLDAVSIKHADITNTITPEKGAAPKKGLREMEKTDPRGLEKIRNEQPDLFASMYKEEYGVELVTV